MERSPRPQTRRRRSRHLRASQRGVAMLMVIIAVALLTAIATEFAYNTRVDMQLAANYRDDIRAYYLARSGIGMSRLVLAFQKQVDSIKIPDLGGLLGALGGGAGGAAGAAGGAGAAGAAGALGGGGGGGLNINLWQLAKVDCHMLQGLVPQGEEEGGETGRLESGGKFKFDEEFPELAEGQARRSFGGFEGCFQAQIQPEETKINLNRLNQGSQTGGAAILVSRLIEVLSDKRFEFLFEKEDSNRVKLTPAELVINIRDWIDEDEVQSQLNFSGQGDVFLRGFSDEDVHYDRYKPRYPAKNALFDTLDELYMVHGVNDAFMAAFRDRFTVFTDFNTPQNINTDDPLLLYLAVLSVADPPNQPALQNPLFVDKLIKAIKSRRMFSFLGMSTADFLTVVETEGVKINSSIRQTRGQNRFISDKNTTYTIKAIGEAGSVQKTITAVVRMDGQTDLGRLLYWREE